MIRAFSYETFIARRPDQVFAYMMDLSRAPRWRNLVRKLEWISPEPIGVGSQLLVTMDVMGQTRQATSEVWAYEPAKRFGVRNTASRLTGTFDYTLSPEGDGTRVRFTCDVRGHGLGWLVLPFAIRSSRARYRDQLPALKREVESMAPGIG
jgi:uncharacterized protein YndB with AHSA1/START domain